ncbi:MAG: type II toxin-antitoxin system PemK/MazF family toxin [Mycobacterium sp.]|nr:type II toxin-antitoxin system PemK/MazF family toxin [Mycobacterium sp.]
MASQWKTLQRFQRNLENLAYLTASEVPKLIRQLQNSAATPPRLRDSIQRGIKIGMDVIGAGTSEPPPETTAGRPVTNTSAPTAHRARRLVYAPDLDGPADPGEVVWTWVAQDDDPTCGNDRPVLVVGRDRHTLLGLMLSGQERHAADRDWVRIGSCAWDDDGRPSWVRLDRVLDVPEEGIRREGAILERDTFDIVAARLRADYSWS